MTDKNLTWDILKGEVQTIPKSRYDINWNSVTPGYRITISRAWLEVIEVGYDVVMVKHIPMTDDEKRRQIYAESMY